MRDSVAPQPAHVLPTRDRLIAAAAELMRRQSYGTVSVDDICRAADVKKGTFYHHFASKIELALATFDHIWAEGRAEFVACLNNTTLTPPARLAAFVDGVVACHRETFEQEGKVYGCPLCNAGSEMGAQDDAIRTKMQHIFDDAVALFAALVAEMPAYVDASRDTCTETARAMMCYMMGVEYQAKVANNPDVIARDLLPGLNRILSSSSSTQAE